MSKFSTESDYDNESAESQPRLVVSRVGSFHEHEHELLTLARTIQTAVSQYMSYVHGRM